MKLVAAEAEKEKIGDPAMMAKRLDYFRKKILMEQLLTKIAKDAVSEEAMKKLYDDTAKSVQPEEEVHARHILVENEADAKKAYDRVKGGEDFAKVAKELSKDPGSSDGGDLGWFTKDRMVKEFADAAFAMKPGDVSQPVKSQFGWHVIKVEERRTKPVPTFDQVKPQIARYLTQKSQQDLILKLRTEAKIDKPEPPAPAAAPRPMPPPRRRCSPPPRRGRRGSRRRRTASRPPRRRSRPMRHPRRSSPSPEASRRAARRSCRGCAPCPKRAERPASPTPTDDPWPSPRPCPRLRPPAFPNCRRSAASRWRRRRPASAMPAAPTCCSPSRRRHNGRRASSPGRKCPSAPVDWCREALQGGTARALWWSIPAMPTPLPARGRGSGRADRRRSPRRRPAAVRARSSSPRPA